MSPKQINLIVGTIIGATMFISGILGWGLTVTWMASKQFTTAITMLDNHEKRIEKIELGNEKHIEKYNSLYTEVEKIKAVKNEI